MVAASMMAMGTMLERLVRIRNTYQGLISREGTSNANRVLFDVEVLCVHQVGGHQAPVEEHGEEHQEGKDVPAGQVIPGKGVCHQGGDDHIGHCADHCHQCRHTVRPKDLVLLLPKVFIRFQPKFSGPHIVAKLDHRRLLCKGTGKQNEDGKNGD